jgi:hypothetical protein
MDNVGSLGVWLKDLISRERRRARRKNLSVLVAYYWDGAAPVAHTVRDVSTTGFYLLTEQRWYRGTMLRMTLQDSSMSSNGENRSIEVLARVIRSGEDGVGFAFVQQHYDDSYSPKKADMKNLGRFLRGIKHDDGQAAMELLLVLPVPFLLVAKPFDRMGALVHYVVLVAIICMQFFGY